MQIPVQVNYNPTEMTVTVEVFDEVPSIDGEIILCHNGSVIDGCCLSTSTFDLPFTEGSYSVHIVTQTWEATGDFEL